MLFCTHLKIEIPISLIISQELIVRFSRQIILLFIDLDKAILLIWSIK